MTKKKIAALVFLICCAPPLVCAESAAHSRVKKAAEYRESSDSAEPSRKPDASPATEEKLADTPKDRHPVNDRESLEKMLEGLMKTGESR